MKLSTIISYLFEADASPEVILDAIVTWENSADVAREKANARWRKWKANQPTNVSKRLPTLANDSRAPAGGLDNLLSKEIPEQKEKKEKNNDLALFKAEFSDIDPELLAALITHRRTKKASLSAVAARGLRKAAGNCGLTISQAIETCIDRNWITVKPEWLKSRTSSDNGQKTYADKARERMNQNGRESIFGNHGNAELLPQDQGVGRGLDDGDLRGRPKPRLIRGNH